MHWVCLEMMSRRFRHHVKTVKTVFAVTERKGAMIRSTNRFYIVRKVKMFHPWNTVSFCRSDETHLWARSPAKSPIQESSTLRARRSERILSATKIVPEHAGWANAKMLPQIWSVQCSSTICFRRWYSLGMTIEGRFTREKTHYASRRNLKPSTTAVAKTASASEVCTSRIVLGTACQTLRRKQSE
jgi:hypothetical protein